LVEKRKTGLFSSDLRDLERKTYDRSTY